MNQKPRTREGCYVKLFLYCLYKTFFFFFFFHGKGVPPGVDPAEQCELKAAELKLSNLQIQITVKTKQKLIIIARFTKSPSMFHV